MEGQAHIFKPGRYLAVPHVGYYQGGTEIQVSIIITRKWICIVNMRWNASTGRETIPIINLAVRRNICLFS
jgi:hypothetical protein